MDLQISDETLNNKQSNEDAVKDTEKRLEPSENGTPKIDTSSKDELQYFQSRDPEPKRVTPVGGSGPTLTKTLVKKNQPGILYNSSDKDASKNNEDTNGNQAEQNELDQEAEELKKLEEEVARLTKEAQSNLHKQDNLAEISVINEQTIMVNGKLKRKKKKKRKRKKIGGGEETIANITVDEISVDQKQEMEEKDEKQIKLNPPKKKHKKPKNK